MFFLAIVFIFCVISVVLLTLRVDTDSFPLSFSLIFFFLVLLILTHLYLRKDLNPNKKKLNQLWLAGVYTSLPNYPHHTLSLKIAELSDSIATSPRTISLDNLYPNTRYFLKKGDFIEFHIDGINKEENSITKWKVRYRVSGTVVRLGNKCINVDQWLGSMDTIVLWTKVTTRNIQKESQNIVQKIYIITHGRKIYFKVSDLGAFRLFNRPLKEGYPLYSVLKKKAIRDTFFAKTFKGIEALARHILLVREIKGDTKSRLGIIVVPFESDTEIYYSYDTRENTKLNKKEYSVTISQQDRPILSIGLGSRNTIGIKLPFKSAGNDKIIFTFTNPVRWQLPPKDTFLIFSTVKDLPFDGYFINVKNELYSVMYKGRFQKGTITIVGDTLITLSKMDKILLGRKDFGFIVKLWNFQYLYLKLIPFLKPLKVKLWNKILSIMFLVLSIFLWWLNKKLVREYVIRLRILLIFFLVYILLLWKFMISLRLASIPPTNSSINELQNVFIKTYKVGFWSLLLIPIVFILALIVKEAVAYIKEKLSFHFNRIYFNKRPRLYLFLFYYALFIILISLSKGEVVSFGFVGIRAYAFLILFILLNYLFIRPSFLFDSLFNITGININRVVYRNILYHFITFILPSFLYLLFVKDMGIMVFIGVYGMVLLILFLLALNINRIGKVFAIVSVIFIIYIVLTRAPQFIVNKRIDLKSGKTIFYRFLVYRGYTEDYLLSYGQNIDERVFDNIYRNSVQAWQMKLYASEGGMLGKGLGNVKLSNSGLTYPTALSDASFSIIILSEFGVIGAILLMLIYTFLGFYLTKFTWKEEYKNFSLMLLTIFSLEPLYMILANLQLLPFTGQNIPLLSFHSMSDLAMVSLTLFIALVSILFISENQYKSYYEKKSINKNFLKLLLSLVSINIFVFFLMFRVVNSKADKVDFDLPDKIKNRIESDVEKYFRFDTDKQKVVFKSKMFPKLLPMERIYINQLNSRTDIYNPQGGLFYVRRSDSTIAMNRYYFRIPSPFKPPPSRVYIYAKYDPHPVFSVYLNREILLLLGKRGFPQLIDIPAIINSNLSIFTRGQNVHVKLYNEILFSLAIKSDSLNNLKYFIVISPGGSKRYQIWVNQKRLLQDLELKTFDIIKIKTKIRYIYMVYLGYGSIPLLYTVWRNGRTDRFLSPVAQGMPFLYLLASQYSAKGRKDVYLTIDPILQTQLTNAIKKYIKIRRRYSRKKHYWNNDPLTGKMVALTIINPYSGEILALAQWPEVRESYRELQRNLYKIPPNKQWRVLSSFNFKNHAIGSTIKPLTLSAISYKYNEFFSIDSLWFKDKADMLRFNNKRGHFHVSLAGLPLLSEKPWNCRPGRRKLPKVEWIDSKNFIIKSLDFYEVMLCMLGMIPLNSKYYKLFLINNTLKENMKIGRRSYYLTFDTTAIKMNFRRKNISYSISKRIESEYPFIVNKNLVVINKSTSFDKLVLFQGYKDLFDVHIVRGENEKTMTDSIYKTEMGQFLGINNREVRLHQLYHILPEPILINSTKFIRFERDLIPFFLGGAENRWNNVKMAEAFARIITGKRVVTRIVKQEMNFENMPPPLNDPFWRYKNILSPMEGTWRVSGGTVYSLRPYLMREVPRGFKIIFKTGTIEEKEGSNMESELLAFMVGKWDRQSHQFSPNSSLLGYFYMEDSKSINSGMYKFALFKYIFPHLKRYLIDRER